MQIILLVAEFLLLYLISRALTQTMFFFFWKITHSRNFALSATTALLFPGTVIHELAHMFTAEILGVRTGGLTLVPEGLTTNEEGEAEIRTGSVSIAKTGPFRRSLIGIAPVFVGLAALGVLGYYLSTTNELVWIVLIGYLLFAISNSLFSSPEDLVGFWPFAITVGLLVGAAWISGIRVELTGSVLTIRDQTVEALVRSLGIVLALNVILLLTTRGLLILTGKTTIR